MLKVLQEKTTAPSPGTTLSSPYDDDDDDDDNDDDDDDHDEYPHQGKGVAHLQALLTPDKVEPALQLTFTSITLELLFSIRCCS